MSVAVAGKVTVGVSVGVGISPAAFVPPPSPRLIANRTITAAMTTTAARMPTAAGRLKVISGMRLAWIDLSTFLTAFGSGLEVNSAPHTRQRVAFSLKRVPQVGQIFVFDEVVSGFIRAEIIPLNDFINFSPPAARC